MKLTPSIWRTTSPAAVRSFGAATLVGTFLFSTVILLYLAWKVSWALPVFFLAVACMPILVYVFRHPLLNLGVVLGLFVFVSSNQEGIQTAEVVYGIYYLAFLAHWFATRLFLSRERIFARFEEKALAAFLILVTLWIPLTFLFGGEPRSILSEWTALMFLGFYFPIREACVRDKEGVKLILSLLLWIGLFAAVRNVIMYRHALADADYAWQIVSGRVWMNDTLLMVTSTVAVALVLHLRKAASRIAVGGVFLVLLVGLILTQSRTMWVAFAIGCLLIFVFIDSSRKKQLLAVGLGGLAISAILGLLFFSQYIDLIFLALVDRFASLGTAFTSDLSLINRFQESMAVLGDVIRNPIIGYGMGVPFRFFDLTHMGTVERTFIHNGYLSLWFKFGILGLGLVTLFWIRSCRSGIVAYVRSNEYSLAAAAGLASAVALACMMLTAITSNPFFLGDTTLTFALLTGLASAAREVVSRRGSGVPSKKRRRP